MNFIATGDGWLEIGTGTVRCALGKGGLKSAADKREGDGASPIGRWAIRRVLFRSDKGPPPMTALPSGPIAPDDGWCDAPDDAAYNRPVRLPYPASCERLWRDDDVYDRVVVLGYNDAPPVAGLGSAIFLHVARPGYLPTEGCVAIRRADLDAWLATVQPGDTLEIRAG